MVLYGFIYLQYVFYVAHSFFVCISSTLVFGSTSPSAEINDRLDRFRVDGVGFLAFAQGVLFFLPKTQL